jgi:hypothetical protein
MPAVSGKEHLNMRLVSTDGSKDALKNIRKNAALNGLGSHAFNTQLWDWRSHSLPAWASKVQVIIGSGAYA